MYSNFGFEVKHCDRKSKARVTCIYTPHGTIDTPAFIFCATKASMKGLTMDKMKELKSQFILSNTYHLLINGHQVVKKLGGLHKACKWNKPMLTDSGGYQVFAMGCGSVSKEIKGNKSGERKTTLKTINEDGAVFTSYKTGETVTLTPERSMQIQRDLGADFIVVFDECTPYHVTKEYTENSMKRSHRWALRCLEEFKKHNDGKQALYGIVQGSIYKDLRLESIEFNNSYPFFGVAIGGSLGDSTEMMHQTVSFTMKHLDTTHRPVHLLGIGKIVDIFHGVRQGVDTFDCVHPTRIARHGCALVKKHEKEHIDLTKSEYKEDDSVIDSSCECPTCKGGYSRMYIRYLYEINDFTAGVLVLHHNIWFMNTLMEDIRKAIMTDTLDDVEREYLVR